MLSGPRSRKDDPTALLTVRCLLRVAATISTTTAARAWRIEPLPCWGRRRTTTMTTVIILDTWTSMLVWEHAFDATNRVVARAFFNNSPSNPQQSGSKTVAAVRKHTLIRSCGQQAFAPPSRREPNDRGWRSQPRDVP